jgi:hypothetical protein
MSVPTRTQDLVQEGVSIWLDDLSRDALQDGTLANLIATRHVSGVTTKPTIFAAALSRARRTRHRSPSSQSVVRPPHEAAPASVRASAAGLRSRFESTHLDWLDVVETTFATTPQPLDNRGFDDPRDPLRLDREPHAS